MSHISKKPAAHASNKGTSADHLDDIDMDLYGEDMASDTEDVNMKDADDVVIKEEQGMEGDELNEANVSRIGEDGHVVPGRSFLLVFFTEDGFLCVLYFFWTIMF
jgi:hypothetical protein